MKKQIFFLIVLVSLSITVQQVYASHYTDIGENDVWLIREHDYHTTNNPLCFADGSGISIGVSDDGVSQTTVRHTWGDLGMNGTDTMGQCAVALKTFNSTNIINGASTNTFTFEYDLIASNVREVLYMMVLDGNYENWYTDTVTIWPNNDGNNANNFEAVAPGTWGNMINPSGPGIATSLSCHSGTLIDNTATCAITPAFWSNALTSQVTVIMYSWVDNTQTAGQYIDFTPEYFSISDTPTGTLQWDWPQTPAELANWNSYGGNGTMELTGTSQDYGYYFSHNEGIADPPTNLYATDFPNQIDLNWDAPVYVGFTPITAYKIERESPVGDGFTFLVANTGSTSTFYSDGTITEGVEYNYRVRALNVYGESLPSNESKDGTPPTTTTEPIVSCDGNLTDFTLFVPVIGINDAVLCWNGGILNHTSLVGYQINYTVPWGDPTTISKNNTGSNATQETLTPLSSNTQYSVRVQSWINGSLNNVTNIANFTTRGGGLEIGNLTIPTEANPLRFDWIFTRDDLNADDVSIAVEYPNAYNATCTMDMKLSRTSLVYSNIATTPHNDLSDRQIANFTFTDYNNEIITMTCVDEITNSTGKYIIYQNDFPMKQQIASFRDGTYGTMGAFGFFDFFTLGAMFFAMIGFNRVHPGVGAVFAMMILGVANYLGFIENIFTTATIGIIMTVVILAVLIQHRNDIIS